MDITNILLADDDEDDRFIFKEALSEIQTPTRLVTAADGEQLMAILNRLKDNLPDVLFLDLNMPGKNGFQCLREIRINARFHSLMIVIFSTSFERGVIENLYNNGANYYTRKPTEFNEVKMIIERVLKITGAPAPIRSIEKFAL